MDSLQGADSVDRITPAEMRRYVAEGHRLRAEAVASALRAAGRALLRVFRTPDAVAHERRERALRAQRARWALDRLPGGAG